MEPSEFLDILGNENRRKIIALLAERPYYVSEMTTRLGVSPKAVIGHLTLLENSGLIEGNTDSRRRKYYGISKSLRLEVSVSPYSYSVHVNNIKLEMPEAPVYSLSLSFDAPMPKSKRKILKVENIPTGPVIHLAQSYVSENGEDEDENEEGGGGGFTIEIVGPSHPFYEHVGHLHGGAGKKYLGAPVNDRFSENDPAEDVQSENDPSEEDFNTVPGGESDNRQKSEIIFEDNFEDNFENRGEDSGAADDAQSNRLQSREGYFLSRIFKVRDDLTGIWVEQQELSRLQEDLTVRQSRLMNSFIHYATQLSDDTVDLDILFRLLKEDMSAAELCHATGHAPSLILPRLKSFEDRKMAEKYLQRGDFVWRLKDGADV